MMKKFLIFIFSLIFILPINIFALDLYRSSEIDINDNSFDSYDMFFSISSYDNLGNYGEQRLLYLWSRKFCKLKFVFCSDII